MIRSGAGKLRNQERVLSRTKKPMIRQSQGSKSGDAGLKIWGKQARV